MKNGRVIKKTEDIKTCVRCTVDEEVTSGEVGRRERSRGRRRRVGLGTKRGWGRREELEFMVKKLDMFEFGTFEEAVSRGSKQRRRSGSKGGQATMKGGRVVKKKKGESDGTSR